MRLDHLQLEHFGPHRSLEFAPSPRLTGIVGGNGSGKSSILDAIEYLLCGAVPRDGAKETNVGDFLPPKGRSFARGTFAIGPHKVEVTRGLKREKSAIAVDGGTPVLGDQAVDRELAGLLGPTRDLLADYVFVKQGRMFGFLEATKAGRAAAFGQLFGTTRAAAAYAALGDALGALEVPPAADPAERDALRAQLGDEREAIEALKAELATYADLEGYDRDADPNQALVFRAHEQRRAAEAREALAARRPALAEAAAKAADDHELARFVRDERAALLADRRAEADKARAILATWDAHQRYLGVVESLRRRHVDLVAEKASHPRPVPLAYHIPGDDPVRLGLIADLERKVANDRAFLATFDGSTAHCPTCGTPTAALADQLAAARERLPLYLDNLNGAICKRDADLAYERARSAWEKWRAGYRARLERYNADLAALPAGASAPTRTRDDMGRVLLAEKATQAACAADCMAAEAAARQSSRLESELAALDARLAELDAELADPVGARPLALAEAALQSVAARLQRRGELTGELRARRAALMDAEYRLEAAKARDAEGARVRALAAHLKALRGVLHWDALPRAAAAGYLARLEAGTNLRLESFGAGFTAHPTADLAFEARFHSPGRAGSVQPATRLSGGQKVLLALAFRTEVNSVFAREVGLLCLDEPTQFLDARNVQALEVALAALRRLAADRGLQALLVTHERRLAHLFDAVVDLDLQG